MLKKVIMMVVALVMIFALCSCETHEHTTITSSHSDGTTDIYEYVDGVMVEHYMIIDKD